VDPTDLLVSIRAHSPAFQIGADHSVIRGGPNSAMIQRGLAVVACDPEVLQIGVTYLGVISSSGRTLR
jgi:hypothetical protein